MMMNRVAQRAVFIFAALITGSQCLAAKSTQGVKKEASYVFNEMPAPENFVFTDQASFKKLLSESHATTKSRGVAASDRDAIEQTLESLPDYKAFRQAFNNATTVELLGALIDKYNDPTVYNTLSDQTKWVVLQLAVLKPFHGFLTRTRPLVEGNPAKTGLGLQTLIGNAQNAVANAQTRLPHTIMLAWMRAATAGIDTFVPTSQWNAGFDYVSLPYIWSDKSIHVIDSEDRLKAFAVQELQPALTLAASRLNDLIYDQQSNNDDKAPVGRQLKASFKEFYFDNMLLNESANFVDAHDQYVKIGRAEVQALLSGYCVAISGIYGSIPYSWTGLLKAINAAGVSFGVGVAGSPSVTTQDRVSRIRGYPNLFILSKQTDLVQKYIGVSAKNWFKEALVQARLAWATVESYKGPTDGVADFFPLIDSRAVTPFSRIINSSFSNVVDQWMDNKPVVSAMYGGRAVLVNFDSLFSNPPSDMKAFLPTAPFYDSTEILTDPKTGIQYRNYRAGNPKTWDVGAFRAYFPGAQTSDDVRTDIRLLASSWGGWVMGLPLFATQF